MPEGLFNVFRRDTGTVVVMRHTSGTMVQFDMDPETAWELGANLLKAAGDTQKIRRFTGTRRTKRFQKFATETGYEETP